ncbi:microtubule-associated protein 4 [Manacus vitellinus]|uniref:microtubule-associated protein 4 n=1 Tax=Manacus vitellinus TaxID=328815 RepID=UPI00115E80BC|nr:microtubule-associated protein 4 [Manacus vitellinus]
MAELEHNLSLADALTEPPHEIEEEVKRDFIATLEAEKFDDVVGETVDKTDYVPLLDDEDEAKPGSQEPRGKAHPDGIQVEHSSACGPTVVENGDHGLGDHHTVFPGEIMDEKLSYKEFLDRNDSWATDERELRFDPQPVFKPMEMADPFNMHRGENLPDLSFPADMRNVPLFPGHGEAPRDILTPHVPPVTTEAIKASLPESPPAVPPNSTPAAGSALPGEPGAAHGPKGAAPEATPVPAEKAGSVHAGDTSPAQALDAGFAPSAAANPFQAMDVGFSPAPEAKSPKAVNDKSSPGTDLGFSPTADAPSHHAMDLGFAPAAAVESHHAMDLGFAPAEGMESHYAMDLGFAPAADAEPPHALDLGFAPAADAPSHHALDLGFAPAAGVESHHAMDLGFAPAADNKPNHTMDSEFAPAAEVNHHHAMDLGFAPAADNKSDHVMGSEFAPAAEVNHHHAMDSEFAPAAETKPLPTLDSGAVPAADPKIAVPGELVTSGSALQQDKSPLDKSPAEATAKVDQESKVPEARVDHLEDTKDTKPPPSPSKEPLPGQTNHLPEPAAPAEAKEDVALENKDLPEKSVPAVVVEAQKEEPEHNHVEPQQGEALPEPTVKPEEPKPVEAVTGNDITAPPNKELPPSPEKKTKPSASTSSPKPAAAKAKPSATTSPKRPGSATSGPNKKATSPTAGPAASTAKRPGTSTTRPSSLAAKETKPKVADAKPAEKKSSLSKPPSSTTPKTPLKSSPAAPKTTAASPVTAAPATKTTSAATPKRPSSIKTDGKPAEAKKTLAKSPSADSSRPRSAAGNATKSSATTPSTAASSTPSAPGAATSRPKPKAAASKTHLLDLRRPADAKKPPAKAPGKPGSAAKPPRPSSSASAPDLKNVRSKVGSTDNIKHQPGGGKGKVEKRPDPAAAAPRPEPSAGTKVAPPKTAVSKEGVPKQPNGKVQIVSKKANYSHVQSKCGSKDNIKHVPGGGNVSMGSGQAVCLLTPSLVPCCCVTLKNALLEAQRCGRVSGLLETRQAEELFNFPLGCQDERGGDVKIENQKLNFKEKAQAKVGSLDNVGHSPAGGAVKG